MRQHIEDTTRPGIALCGAAYEHIDPKLTVIFCQECVRANQAQASAGEKGDYLDGFDDGIGAAINALRINAGRDGVHGFIPAYMDAAAFLQMHHAQGRMNPDG